MSALSRSTSGAGVAAGTTTPCQVIASKPGTPASETVGSSGTVPERCAVVTASARSRPALIYGITEAEVANMSCACPAITSVSASCAPLYGMCTICTPVIALKSSPASCAAARGRVVQLARLRLRQGDQLLHRPHRNARIHDEDVGLDRDQRDRREVLDRVVAELAVKALVGREDAVVAEEPGGAVGRALRDQLGGDIAAGPGAVLDP